MQLYSLYKTSGLKCNLSHCQANPLKSVQYVVSPASKARTT